VNDCNERLVSRFPVVVRRRVAWGECDPAGVVYTPRFADYVVLARDWFTRSALGFVDRPHPSRQAITYPTKALAFEFASFLAADDVFDMTVEIAGVTRRTFTTRITARHVERSGIAFLATLTSVCVDQALGTAIELPGDVRSGLKRYQEQTAR